MSLLSGRKAYKSLQENKCYIITMKGFTETEATEPNDKVLGFISFKLEVTEDEHPITDTRSVPQGTDILARQIVEQLATAGFDFNGIEQEELFKRVIDAQIPLRMWVTKREVDNQWYTNYTFQEPVQPKSATTNTVDNKDFE